jgi:hypothetical protein
VSFFRWERKRDVDINDLPPKFVRENAAELEKQGVEVPDYLKESAAKVGESRQAKLERDLQHKLEDWLRMRGYYRRSPSDIGTVEKAPRGWQVHIHEAKKNPILLDILLLGNDGRYLEFELKCPPIRYSSQEQRILCTQYYKPVVVSLEGAIELVKRWEGE